MRLPRSGFVQTPYVDSAIDEAQRAGVIIYSIYTPGAWATMATVSGV